MLEHYCRPNLQRWLIDPLAKPLAAALNANQVTLLSLLSGLACLPALLHLGSLCATLLLLFSGLFDVLDGSVARLRGESSLMGSIYDVLADRCVEAAIILAFFLQSPDVTRGLLCLLMLASVLICVTTFLLAGIATENSSDKSFHYSVGIMERAEAFIFFLAMFWLPGWFVPLAILFTTLVFLTALIRLMELRRMHHS